jgi:hypothetical protein
MEMNGADVQTLRGAVEKLERQSFAVELANKAGVPLQALMRHLPARAQEQLGHAVTKTLEHCLQVAMAGLHGERRLGTEPRKRGHTILAGATGAVGGFFGLAGLALELPVSTTLMLHSIAEIAANEGEDLGQPEGALACLEVLALGRQGGRTEALEGAYYASRAALTQATREAVAYLAERGVARGGTPALLQFLSKIGARFGLEVTEKAAAQLVPIAGAVGGAAVNVMFTQHFQRLAEGHFAVRRMERRYGAEVVGREYERLRVELPGR